MEEYTKFWILTLFQISLFEDLVDNTIEDTKSIPQDVATTGKVNMSRRDIMKHIGELFILRININLQGSVLDSPELMWAVCCPPSCHLYFYLDRRS